MPPKAISEEPLDIGLSFFTYSSHYKHNHNTIHTIHSLANHVRFWLVSTPWLYYLVYDADCDKPFSL